MTQLAETKELYKEPKKLCVKGLHGVMDASMCKYGDIPSFC